MQTQINSSVLKSNASSFQKNHKLLIERIKPSLNSLSQSNAVEDSNPRLHEPKLSPQNINCLDMNNIKDLIIFSPLKK